MARTSRPGSPGWWLAGSAFLLIALATAAESRAAGFGKASVRFEQNASDGDVEVVFEVKGRKEGLAKLSVVSPDGRTVIDFRAPDASTLGIRQFEFESPEPSDVAALKAAYPEGVYRFSATSIGGKELRGESTLSHALPATAGFLRPAAEAEGVRVEGMEVAWVPVAGVAATIVEIENDELGVHFEVTLPAPVSKVGVPDGILAPATEYELAIGTVSAAGNISFVETSFTTAK